MRSGALVAAAGVAVALLWQYAVAAHDAGAHFAGYPADGPFQLFNPLRRMAAGQVPGRDFHFFHGIAIPWIHYPLFALAGEDLYASELARAALSSFAAFACTAVYVRATRASAGTALAAAAVFALAAPTVVAVPLVRPFVSLTSVRTAAPVLVAALLLVLARRWAGAGVRGALRAGAAGGASLAVALTRGTEQGLAAMGALVLAGLVAWPAPGWRPRLALAGAAAASFAIAGLALFALLSAGHPLSALRYLLRDVPADQFWYFGAPPNPFAASLSDFSTVPGIGWLAPLPILLWIVLVPLRRAEPLRADRFVLVFLLAYAAAASLPLFGALFDWYLAAPVRAEFLAAVHLGALAYRRWGEPRLPARARAAAAALPPLAAALALATCPAIPPSVLDIDWAPSGRTVLGAELHRTWAESIDVDARVLGDRPVPARALWTTYSGLPEAARGYFMPANDYVIHALGPDGRKAYVDTWERARPGTVRVMRRSLFQYEQWLQDETWPFYETLARNYVPVDRSFYGVYWKRAAAEWSSGPGWAGELPAFDRTRLPVPAVYCPSVLTVELDYELENPWRAVPFFGGVPRYLALVRGTRYPSAVSLPPYARSFRFPVFFAPGDVPFVVFTTASLLPGARLVPRSLRWRLVDVPCDRVGALLDLP